MTDEERKTAIKCLEEIKANAEKAKISIVFNTIDATIWILKAWEVNENGKAD